MKPGDLFAMTLRGPWRTSGLDVQWRIETVEGATVLVLQPTSSGVDWATNFDFAPIAYKESPKPWRAHRGYVKAWKSVREEIMPQLTHAPRIIIAGYSYGGALAQLAHEDVVFNMPFMPIATFTFGAPRVCWMPPREVRERFHALWRYERGGDIVTKVPPALAGFCHVGKRVLLGREHFPPTPLMHYPERYREELNG